MPRSTFTTPIGVCAISWGESGLTGFELPEAATRSDDLATLPDMIAGLVGRVQRHLAGDPQDFSNATYDFGRVPEFYGRVLRATLKVKSGQTCSYGDIAAALGQPPGASRAVGTVLGANPWPLLVPCHRVVAADGKMTGFSGPGGVRTKLKLLAIEGAQLFPI